MDTPKTVMVLKPVYVPRFYKVDEVEIINTSSGSMRCRAHIGEVGEDNPKVTVKVGKEYYLLCKACAIAQGFLKEEDDANS